MVKKILDANTDSMMSVLAQVAIKYCGLGGLADTYFSWFWRLEGHRSRCRQIKFLMRLSNFFLVFR